MDAGNPSLVFDCIYHTSVKSRTLIDPEFKIFLVELALQRLEAQTSLVLSRQIGTPNISSKGKLLPRTVLIPSFLAEKPQHSNSKPLIEEVAHASTSASSDSPGSHKPKAILKASPPQVSSLLAKPTTTRHEKLSWTWSKIDERLRIVISVPALITSDIAQTTLDIEPRRFIVSIPGYPTLDVNLVLSDAEIVATSSSKTSVSLHGTPDKEVQEPSRILMLKRQRDLDVDGATAEWHVAEGNLVLLA
ncbi:hypothetical protein BDZ94DRAFT_924939 [Collybia nuda]|uniref:PIH1 N-terminal domain-containing protein n=1 Tax=Collybia nuda TaxID=64659 RepID=A0A9P5Y181_9AGAR|nr:hypothetical protein BDZ94DRAFT_924939 [Collybia nuda]